MSISAGGALSSSKVRKAPSREEPSGRCLTICQWPRAICHTNSGSPVSTPTRQSNSVGLAGTAVRLGALTQRLVLSFPAPQRKTGHGAPPRDLRNAAGFPYRPYLRLFTFARPAHGGGEVHISRRCPRRASCAERDFVGPCCAPAEDTALANASCVNVPIYWSCRRALRCGTCEGGALGPGYAHRSVQGGNGNGS